MEMNVATIVDIGTSYSKNDDRALVDTKIYDHGYGVTEEQLPLIVAVCDGVGGYSGGGYAAQWVLTELAAQHPANLLDQECLEATLASINERLLLLKSRMPEYSEMCTTIAGVIFGDSKMLVFHAGDSRVYRFDGYYLSRLTIDHSYVQSMVEHGLISEQDITTNPERNKILRFLGGKNCLPPELYLSNVPAKPGELYLLCSDGLWEGVSDRQIKQVLASNIPLMEKASLLVELAKEGGSIDNISICLCECPGKVLERSHNSEYVLD